MNFVTQNEASKIADISRQCMSKLAKRGNHNFFVNVEINGKTCIRVDIDSMSWHEYLQDKKEKQVNPPSKKTKINKSKSENGVGPGEKKPKIIANKQSMSPDKYYTENLPIVKKNQILSLSDQQKIAIIKLKQLEFDERISNLVCKDIIESKMGQLYAAVKANFVDYSKNVAPIICAKLDCVGMEKIVEIIIGDDMENRIENVLQSVAAVRDVENV